ncbi:MAG TPA: hypothetical protein VFR78_00835 [Pyrinomonadaceae bacterium]|nr:hypothetical protein [Pyrinomonadaceae bacterium]
MDSLLFGIPSLDFIMIAAGFILTMLLHFGVTDEKRFWANFMLVVFAMNCLIVIFFNQGLKAKIFAALMLGSALVVRLLTRTPRVMAG